MAGAPIPSLLRTPPEAAYGEETECSLLLGRGGSRSSFQTLFHPHREGGDETCSPFWRLSSCHRPCRWLLTDTSSQLNSSRNVQRFNPTAKPFVGHRISPTERAIQTNWTAPLCSQYKPDAQASVLLTTQHTRLRVVLVFIVHLAKVALSN